MRLFKTAAALVLVGFLAGCAGSGTQISVEEHYGGQMITEAGEPVPLESREGVPRTEEIDSADWYYLSNVGEFDAIIGYWHGFGPDASWWDQLRGMERSVQSPRPGVFVIWLTGDPAAAPRVEYFAFLRYDTINFARRPSGIDLAGSRDKIELNFSLAGIPGKSLRNPRKTAPEDGTPTLARLTGQAKVSRRKLPELPLADQLGEYARSLPDSELGKSLSKTLTGPKPIEALLPLLRETFATMKPTTSNEAAKRHPAIQVLWQEKN